MHGWERITPTDRWRDGGRWGWLDEVEAIARPVPDPLGEDYVTGSDDTPVTLRLRCPDGPAEVAVLLGILSPTRKRLPACYREPVVLRVGTTVAHSSLAPWDSLRLLRQPYLPGRSFWETYVRPRYEWLVARTEVRDGTLDINLSPDAPLCGVIVASGSTIGRLSEETTDAETQRRTAFDRDGWQPTAAQSEFDRLAAARVPAQPKKVAVRLLDPEVELRPWTGREWSPDEPLRPLRLAITPGEWEVFTVAAHSDQARELTIALSDLRYSGVANAVWAHPRIEWGTTYWQERPAEEGSTDRVRHYEVEEAAILPGDRLLVPAGCTARWWGRLKAPDDAVPGIYSGNLTISDSAGEVRRATPVNVEVYPFRLRRDERAAVLYFGFRGLGERRAQESWLRRNYAGLAEYGLVPAHVSATSRTFTRRGTREVVADWSDLDREIRDRRAAGALAGDHRLSLVLLNQARFFGSSWLQGPWGSGRKRIYFSEEPEDWQRLQAVVRSAIEHGRRAGWPELLFEMGGELHNYREDGSGLRWGLKAYTLLHDAGGKTLLRANGETDLKVIDAGVVDVAMVNRRLLRGQHMQRIARAGAELALYNFSRHRFGWGWYRWRVGARRIGHEGFAVYYGEPFNDWDGPIPEWGLAQPLRDGFAPRPELEWIREGIDDTAYIATLEGLMAELHSVADPGVVTAVHDAEETLRRWRARIQVDVAGPREDRFRSPDGNLLHSPWAVHQSRGWTLADMDHARREVADAIIRLQRVRKEKAPRPPAKERQG
jgi:hypothetical protein